jgi:hypothetical protein
MKTLKVRQKIETLLNFPVSWQQCYSWFEELPTGCSTMEELNTTAQQQCKMAAPLSACTREEQCFVICFLSSEGVKPTEIHRRMEVHYDDACLSLQQVYEWKTKFLNGVSSVADSPRPGQAHRIVTPEAIAALHGTTLEHYMARGNTVTSATYADLLRIISVLQSSPNDVDV